MKRNTVGVGVYMNAYLRVVASNFKWKDQSLGLPI